MILRSDSSEIRYRVYYKDTDAGGIMYHAKFLELMEMGRSDFLRKRGFSPKRLNDFHHLLYPVVELKIHYQKPAYLEDELSLLIRLKKATSVRLCFDYQIFNQYRDLIVIADTQNASVSQKNFRPTRIPQEIFEKISKGL